MSPTVDKMVLTVNHSQTQWLKTPVFSLAYGSEGLFCSVCLYSGV